MAVLNKIRQRSLFLILIIALALFSFVLADLFRNSDALTSASQDVVASINGKDIKRVDFMRRVEGMQRQLGPNGSSTQAMNRVWDQEVRSMVMESEFDNLGLTVEKDQMRELLKNSFSSYNEFKNEDGFFDENKLNEFISNLKAIAPERAPLGTFQISYAEWVNNESAVATNALQQDYNALVKAGVGATLFDAKSDYGQSNEKVDLSFAFVPYITIADSLVTVTKSDIKAYINDHKEEFQVEESRDISYVEFRETATLDDEKNIKTSLVELLDDRVEYNEGIQSNDTILGLNSTTDIEEFVNSNSDIKYANSYVFKSSLPKAYQDVIFDLGVGENHGPYKDAGYFKLTKVVAEKNLPDSAKVRHILVPFAGASSAQADVTRTEAQAKTLADSLFKVVKRNRSKFESLVTDFSSDQGSIANGGEYDYHPYNTMVKPFNDFEFEGKKGDLGVVKTVFGFHVIEILGQTDKQRALKLATLAQTIEPSEETIDQVFNTTSKFELALQNETFDKVAQDQKYVVKPVSNVKVLDENIPGLQSQRAIVRWAFEKETKSGDYKRFSIPGKGYVVATVTSINNEGLSSVEKASAKILPIIRNQKKAELIKSGLTENTVEGFAKAKSVSVKTAKAVNIKNPTLAGAGREPKVVGEAFGLSVDQTSGLIDGQKGVFIIKVTAKEDAPQLDNYQAVSNRITNATTNRVNTVVFNALKEASDIEDYRANFY